MKPNCNPRCIVLVVLLLLCACTVRAQKWSFVFFADTQDPEWGPWMNTNVMAELALAITNDKPDLVLFGGDLANHPQPPVPPSWTNIMAPIYASGARVYAVLGNHDNYEVPGFVRAFGPDHPDNGPEGDVNLTYALNHKNALILGLNAFSPTNEYRVNQPWVEAVLATNAQPHVFAFSHPAAFKLQHGNCLGMYPTNRDALWRSLTQAGARMYFSGHDHFYDHTRLDDGDGNENNDLHQVISGTGGAALYADSAYDGQNGAWTPVRVLHDQNHGYVLVEIDGPVVTSYWKRRTGPGEFQVKDVFSYTVGGARPLVEIARRGDGAVVLSWSGGALQTSQSLDGPFTTVADALSPYVIGDQSRSQMFYRVQAAGPQ